MHRPFRIVARIKIEKDGRCFLDEKRVELLKRIKMRGSILAASKDMGISYQQAWTIIREINKVAPLPVVMRRRGGADGGGATVTNFGMKLIDRFDELQHKHQKYVSELEENMDICIS
jgi:molybdate transport system regulatory protein